MHFFVTTIITHLVGIPPSLVLFPHLLYVLMEPSPMLFSHIAQIFRPKVEMVVQEMDFKPHQTSQIFQLVYHISYDMFVVRVFHIVQKHSHIFLK